MSINLPITLLQATNEAEHIIHSYTNVSPAATVLVHWVYRTRSGA